MLDKEQLKIKYSRLSTPMHEKLFDEIYDFYRLQDSTETIEKVLYFVNKGAEAEFESGEELIKTMSEAHEEIMKVLMQSKVEDYLDKNDLNEGEEWKKGKK
jgi:hypothetical protein